MSGTLYYLQHGEEELVPLPKHPRAAAELEVRPGHNKEDQIGVVVAALLDGEKSEVLDWVKTVVAGLLSEIHAWETEAIAKQMEGELGEDEITPRQPLRILHFFKFLTKNCRLAIKR
jgi:replication fork protection complex subunit Tof1/Swi1